MATPSLDDFLQPLAIDIDNVIKLSHEMTSTFRHLSAEASDQFLPTPISESVLRPTTRDQGRFLAIDIGGSNLRVGFVELLSGDGTLEHRAEDRYQPNRLLEQSWPIQEHLKNQNSESLFSWIGEQVAQVVRKGCETLAVPRAAELPMGVTFSFPMQQKSLSKAILMPMGKGFAVTSNLDLGAHLTVGYEKHRAADMPPIRIAAIANDAVATLVSFIYQFPVQAHQKAAMGLIVGTGCNATLPLKLSTLHESKRPASISILPGQEVSDVKIAVNTEWSIRGTTPPLRKLGFISRWDTELDQAGEIPGFQPLEYMTAGRYLGELARLIFIDYYGAVLGLPISLLPNKLHQRFGLPTTFISHLRPKSTRGPMLQQLEREFAPEDALFRWTAELANVLYRIAKAIEVRAAGIIAASTVGLLRCAEEIPQPNAEQARAGQTVLSVGYTGGCIQHFQDYLGDTQGLIDEILDREFNAQAPIKVVLTPCHDGGITGAGILVPAALANRKAGERGPKIGRMRFVTETEGVIGDFTDIANSNLISVCPASPAKLFHQIKLIKGRQELAMTTERADTACSGPMSGAEPIPTSSRTRPSRRRSRDDDGSASSGSEDIDPNQLDMLLSRSVQSSAAFLEPESFQHSMLRNTRVHSRSRSRRRDATLSPYRGRRHPSTPRAVAKTSEGEVISDEETPLLLDPAEDLDKNSKSKNPYLGGVSVTRFWLLFIQINASYFIACFDSTIMASSHPVITSYFGSSNSASWLSTAFLLTSTSFQPILGGLSDAVGRKGPYVFTIVVFLFATVWCALAQSMTSFIIARAVCGFGAGGLMALGSIIVSDTVPIEIRGAFQSYVNMTYGFASMLGAALGGAMADYLGWRWEFGIQVPIIVLCLIVAVFVVPSDLGLDGKKKQTVREAMRTFDFKGSILLSSSVTSLILGLNLGGNVLPWSHPFVIASLMGFAIFFPPFLYVETRAVKPIMPLHLILKSPYMNLIFSNHIAALISNAILFNVPLFFQGVLLTTATTSGFRLVVSSGVASACGTATGFLISYTRRLKWPLVLGTTLGVIGAVSLTSMQRGWPTALYILCLIPGSAGSGFQFPGTFMALLTVSEQREQAVVTSTLILWRSLGQVLGVACSSLVVQNALWYYLDELVTGPKKEEVVALVRKSVEAIRDLPVEYREPVVQSYEAALRITFLCCTALAVVGFLLVLPMRLPRLGTK
ncbi:uncharacterized protein B0H64DRAFT_374796 [Chaetomium fimeti]|uniref:Major facilitator superfamily (MFS) profile domain-containing protein n=1 Tax=Chaetomium fimeti TaxID=1854472 RepID=A0AAE0HE45_9PEZI|nr:hypothetical protein B0H64DRAFT_374796 [Chaetomium fimeti]